MSLIAQSMPDVSMREIRRVAVEAEPEQAFTRLRAVDLNELKLIRRLRLWHALPGRVRAWWRGRRLHQQRSLRIEDVVDQLPGACVIAERRGEEVVLGFIGKLWSADAPLERVAPREFKAFAKPGFGKLALALRVSPRSFGGSWLSVEVRASGTDADAQVKLRRAWPIINAVVAALSGHILQLVVADLGPLVEDESIRLPGDALLQDAPFQATHALTIEARPQEVWGWLLAVGAESRACAPPQHEAEGAHARPEVGEFLPGLSGRRGESAVLRTEPGHLLILGTGSLLPNPTHQSRLRPALWSTTWVFLLLPIGDDATRLVVRVRSRLDDALGIALLEPLVTAVHDALGRRRLESLSRQAASIGGARDPDSRAA